MTQLAIIGVYLALLLALGLFSSRLFRGTGEDYMLASHSIGPFLLLMSLFGTTMTAFALVGSTGEAFREGIGVYGLMASSSGIVHSLCFLLIGVKIWSFGQKHGYTTQIQFFRDRLGSNGIGLLLFPIIVGLVIPYLLIGVLASGQVVNGATLGTFPEVFASTGGGVPRWLAALVICGVVLIYVFFGGMRGTAWANTFQTSVFMILGVVTFVVIANGIGGQDGFWANMQAASAKVAEAHPDRLTRSEMSKFMFTTYLLIPLSVGMFPHVFQHWLTARSAQTFKLPVIVHPLFIMLVWAPCVMIGVWATSATLNGELIVSPGAATTNKELTILVAKLAGPVLGGLLSAGILAAIMSSLDSQFLCIGSIFTNDIVLHYWDKKRFTEKQIVMWARLFVVAIVAVTYGLSLFEPRSVFAMGIWCFSGYTGLFPLVFAALYWKRLSVAGAYASVLTVAGMWLWLFAESGFGANANYTFQLPAFGQQLEMMPVLPITVAAVVALVAVSLVTSPPPDETVRRFFPESKS